MANYSMREYTDMVIMYGVAGENALAAARLYAERFPEREQHPGVHTILRCIHRFRQTRSVLQNRRYEGIINIRVDAEERILRAFEENPRSSIRRVGHTLGLPRNTVHRALRRNGLHPYHFQRVQQLLARDQEPRIYFCE
ncbi:PREDICTED: uncharacterized protein LOC108771621, partial [Cyphomyrmex costatus]|uniref:uncharacterized protein LOC108771621 n=1 Tax=Cyphomyrmex costatus TaxID=456900 RepID=UPI0008521F12